MTKAAENWVIRFQTGVPTAAERRSFEQWLLADKQNQEEYEKALATWKVATKLSLAPRAGRLRAEAHEYFSPRRSQAWSFGSRVAIPAAAFCFLLLRASFVGNDHFVSEDRTTYHTPVGQTQHVTLADGTAMDVSADTDIVINFEGPARNVTLLHGEAFFAVDDTDPRPFLVHVEGTLIRDVGTRFNVSTGESGLDVAVAEGRVAVAIDNSKSPESRSVLDAGIAAHVSADHQNVEISQVDPSQVAAWRGGWLNLSRTPLKRILQDMNRYNLKKITSADDRIADLTLAGRVRTDDVESLVTSLQSIYGITFRDFGDRIELFAPKDTNLSPARK